MRRATDSLEFSRQSWIEIIYLALCYKSHTRSSCLGLGKYDCSICEVSRIAITIIMPPNKSNIH